MHTADEDMLALTERVAPPIDRGQRAFRLALLAALLLHAAIFIEVGRSVPRAMGDKSGASDAIAVDIVTEADLKSTETVATPPPGAPPPPAQKPPETPPEPKAEAEAAQPPPPDTPAKETPKQETKTAAIPDFETLLPDLASTPQPKDEPAKEPSQAAEPAEAKPEQAKPPEKKATEKKAPEKDAPAPQARLTPQDLESAPPGRSAGATRPPGITRSGENDDFGRAVVRALRQTMPPPRGIFGRVTVRLILTENGDLAQVIMLDPSGTKLDTDVVFAAKQTYFPLPPYKSTVADRTFTISYVYR